MPDIDATCWHNDINKTLLKLKNERRNKMYKCIEGFSLEKHDEDGFTVDGEYMVVDEGSIWHIPEDKDYRLVGGDIRLENDEDIWIEISNETLAENFEKIN